MLVHLYLSALILQYLRFCGSERWVWKGCFWDDDAHPLFAIQRDNGMRFTFLQCVRWGEQQGFNKIALQWNGLCFGCKDCSHELYGNEFYGAPLKCPDYGGYHQSQVYALQDDEIELQSGEADMSSDIDFLERSLSDKSFYIDEVIQHINKMLKQNRLEKIENIYGDSNYNQVYEDFCYYLFEDLAKDNVSHNRSTPLLHDLPPEFLLTFAQENTVPIFSDFQTIDISGENFPVWTLDSLKELVNIHYCFSGDLAPCTEVFRKYVSVFNGTRGLVLGTESPWLEATLLSHGANHIVTVEYRSILSQVASITTLLPVQVASRYLSGDFREVDFAFSFSSIEHSGLGRYGDVVDPFADLKAMQQISCILKVGGLFFLGIPVGPDAVFYNSMKVYGYYNLILLLQQDWDVIDVLPAKIFDLDTFPKHSYNTFDIDSILVLRKVREVP
jgi:hypothetical protein